MPTAAAKPKPSVPVLEVVAVEGGRVAAAGETVTPSPPPAAPPDALRTPLIVYREDRRYLGGYRTQLWRAVVRDFTATDLAIFALVSILEATTAEAIARRLGLPLAATEQALRALEDVGLVRRDLPTWQT